MQFLDIKEIIKNKLTDAYIKIEDMTGTGDHLDFLIVSDQFIDKRLIQQHQLIMDLLSDSLKAKIHAVQLKTMTFEQANKRGINTQGE